MAIKLLAIAFSGAVVLGICLPATEDCCVQGYRDPVSGAYTFKCPAVACDQDGECEAATLDERDGDGTGSVYFYCDCTGEVIAPLPCETRYARYVYHVVNGELVRSIDWDCTGGILCDGSDADECIEIHATGWTQIPFYLCDCP